jgi:uncharacterized membrane protein YcaP (DUF421 family)
MEIAVRAFVIFFFLWFITRVMGKRELAQMSAFELILLVTIGDLVQQGVTQEDNSLTGNMLAVSTLAFLTLVFSYVSYRWKGARTVIESFPVVIVRDGELLEAALKIERLTKDEVLAEAREQGIDDLAKVRLAVLEPDGKFSFIQAGGGSDGPDADETAGGPVA